MGEVLISWQGRIPYNRLLTTQRTGYYDAYTEASHKENIKSLISENIAQKRVLRCDNIPTFRSDRSSLVKQDEIAEKSEKINDGVLSKSELDILVEMVKYKN